MSSSPAEHLATYSPDDRTKPTRIDPEMTETNHDLPARAAKNDEHTHHDKDDAATIAASEELKHTTISDKVAVPASEEGDVSKNEGDQAMTEPTKAQTPEAGPSDARDEEMRERISSPKKKRGRDFEDDILDRDSLEGNDTGSEGGVNTNRTTREEPEKKRPRDTSAEPKKTPEKLLEEKETTAPSFSDAPKTAPAETDAANKSTKPAVYGTLVSDKPQTSSSAFASSGFASLASSTSSPFGTLGASKPSVFGGSSSTTSGFGALAGSKSPTASTTIPVSSGFGGAAADKPASGFAFGSGAATSGFGGLNKGSVFGSALGNGFAGGSGPKLSSFAAPTKESVIESKPAKAFGAPDSDEDADSDQEDSDGGTYSEEEEGVKVSSDEKKKVKAVKVEDGESGEVTLLQIRAKLFALGSKEVGWKERGVGSLKINVPSSCVSFDENQHPLPGSFDLSGLNDEEDEGITGPRVPRLIMRQENTHRVILNTVVVRAMEFKDKASNTAAQIIFTAFEGEKEPKPIQMLLKISENNARLFKSEIASIQREL